MESIKKKLEKRPSKREFINFYVHWQEAIDMFDTDAEELKAYNTIFDYAFYEEVPNLKEASKLFQMFWLFIKSEIDRQCGCGNCEECKGG